VAGREQILGAARAIGVRITTLVVLAHGESLRRVISQEESVNRYKAGGVPIPSAHKLADWANT
jgi:hypothetical protein